MPKAFAYLFAANGGVGVWIPNCPHCGHEHIHGPFSPHEFVDRLAALNSRGAHCGQAPYDQQPDSNGSYDLAICTPAMIVPGQESGRWARMHLAIMEDEGCAVSRTSTLPSRKPVGWWRKKTGGMIKRHGGRY